MFKRIITVLSTALVLVGLLPLDRSLNVYADSLYTLTGTAHVQDIGDTAGIWDASTGILTLGTRGQSRRVEAITINLENNTGLSSSIEYRVHVQDIGWQDYRNAGEQAGTEGQAKRLEGIEMILTGELAEYYSVVYRVHIQDYGDAQGWVSDGALAGTTGESKRLEEIQVKLVPKYQGTSTDVNYRVHRQDYGWESCWKNNGEVSGTTGESKRLEGIEIHLSGLEYPGGIRYKTHIQNIGWESDWSYDGEMSGTQGMSYRLEAIQIELYGEISLEYDVYYRVHAQDYGWLGWAKNGETNGTAGLSKRLEAIQIVVVRKGDPAPGDVNGISSNTAAISYSSDASVPSSNSILSGNYKVAGDSVVSTVSANKDSLVIGEKGSGKSLDSFSLGFCAPDGKDISMAYRSYLQGVGWFQWSPSGQEVAKGQSSGIETVQIMLFGKDMFMYDVSYRIAYVGQDWQDWVDNGAMAGTTDQTLQIEAIEIKLELHEAYETPNWTITEFGDDDGRQSEFYTIKNNDDGTLIVIDGGWDANTEQVRSIINLFGGKVDYWFITHYDADHVSAFNNIYADPQGITIGTIYATPLDYDLYCSYAANRWWDTPEVYKLFLDQTAGDNRVVYLERDDCFDIAGLNICVFNAYDQLIADMGNPDVANYASLVFKISGEEDSFLVCADVYGPLWTELVSMYGEKLEADYVQLGHHGNMNFQNAPEEWAIVDADTAFFDGPAWLTQSDNYSVKGLMEWCIENDIETYDFGSAPNSVPFE